MKKKLILVNQSDGLTGRISSIIEAYAASRLSDATLKFAWPDIEIESNRKHYSTPQNPAEIFNENFIKDSLTTKTYWDDTYKKGNESFLYFKYGDHHRPKNIEIKRQIKEICLGDIFAAPLKKVFESIDKLFLDSDLFYSVHFRCGDVFYGDYTDNEAFVSDRTLDYTQVIHICKNLSSSNKFFLFGATTSDLNYVKSLASNVFTLEDLDVDLSHVGNSVLVLIEAYIAAKSKFLFCSKNSHVARLVYTYNPGIDIKRLTINDKNYLEISSTYFDVMHPTLKHNAKICFRRFLSLYRKKYPLTICKNQLLMGSVFDKEYEGYRVYYLVIELLLSISNYGDINKLSENSVLFMLLKEFYNSPTPQKRLSINSKIGEDYEDWCVFLKNKYKYSAVEFSYSRYFNECVLRFLIATGPKNAVLISIVSEIFSSLGKHEDTSYLEKDLLEVAEKYREKMNNQTLSVFGIELSSFVEKYNCVNPKNIDELANLVKK